MIMKKKKIVIVIVFLFLIIGVGYYQKHKLIDESKAEYIETIVDGNGEVKEVLWLNNHKWLLIKEKETNSKPYYKGTILVKHQTGNDIVGKKYYFKNQRITRTNVETENKVINKANVTIYKIKEASIEKWKSLDLIKLSKDNDIKGQPSGFLGVVLDEELIRYEMIDKEEDTWKTYYIRIGDEKIYTAEEFNKEYPEYSKKRIQDKKKFSEAYETDLSLFTNFSDRQIIWDGGVIYSSNLPHIIFYINKNLRIGTKKSLLFAKYPAIEKTAKELKKNESLYLHFLEDPPDVKEIMKLMIPEGENPFNYGEEVIYDKGNSVEGEDLGKTVLHSFEEFKKEHEAKMIREDEIERLRKINKEQEDTAYDE